MIEIYLVIEFIIPSESLLLKTGTTGNELPGYQSLSI